MPKNNRRRFVTFVEFLIFFSKEDIRSVTDGNVFRTNYSLKEKKSRQRIWAPIKNWRRRRRRRRLRQRQRRQQRRQQRPQARLDRARSQDWHGGYETVVVSAIQLKWPILNFFKNLVFKNVGPLGNKLFSFWFCVHDNDDFVFRGFRGARLTR